MSHVVDGLVFGLHWQTAISDDRAELRQLSGKKANLYSEVLWDSSRKYGFADLKKAGKVRSAAAALAEIMGDAGGVFVHNIGENLACFIAVSKHMPVEGMDIVGSRSEMLGAARTYLANRDPDTVLPKTYGDASPDELSGVQSFPLSRLLEESLGIGELKPISQVNTRAVFITVAVVAMSLTWFADDVWKVVQPQPEPLPPDPKVLHHEAVTAAINDVVARNQFPADVLAGFIPFANSIAWEAAGWQLTKVSCVDSACIATWERRKGATAQGILDALSLSRDDATIAFPDVDHMTRKVSFTKTKNVKKLMLVPNATFARLVLTWFHQIKDRGYNVFTSTSNPVIPPPAGVQLDPGATPYVGDYAVKVPFNELSDVAKLPEMMTVENVELNSRDRGKVTVEFKGKYYAF